MDIRQEIIKQLANHDIYLDNHGYLCSKYDYKGRGKSYSSVCVTISCALNSLTVSLSYDELSIIRPSIYKISEITQENVVSTCSVIANDYRELVNRALQLTTPM